MANDEMNRIGSERGMGQRLREAAEKATDDQALGRLRRFPKGDEMQGYLLLPHIDADDDFREAIQACNAILTQKGHDYTQGDVKHDRLKNFDRNGGRLNLRPEQVLAIYMFKHIDAIETYLRLGAVESEPIEGRIFDAINYLLLLYKMVKRGHSAKEASRP